MSEFNFLIQNDYKALIRNGDDFLEAARRCAGIDENGHANIISDDKLTIIPAPTVVNAAFAIEMYLKSLWMFNNMSFPTDKNGHNILYLFQQLPETIKTNINSFCGNKKDEKHVFELFATKHYKDFVDIRYYVTKPGWQGMDPMVLIMYAFNLSQVTKLIVKNKINNN